jgi:DNA polymerase-3 subunit gamma/tau
MDVLEIDGASNTGVDDVRELRESVKYVPSRSRYKIYIIDEVHMLSNSAFNALLKTLEEPPAHVIFMFATTEPHKILPTVLSRCQRFDLRRLSLEAIVEHLHKITSKEDITISRQGLRWIASEAEGSMRDAQSILDRVISYAGKQIEDNDIVEVLGIVDKDLLMRTSQALLDKDAKGCLDIVRELFRFGYDTRQFYQAFLEHLRNIIIIKISKEPARLMDLSPDECGTLKKQVKDCEVEMLQRLFDVWFKAEEEINRSSQPHIVLEMILLKMVYLGRLVPLDDALAKLSDLEKRILGKKAVSESGVARPLPAKPVEYEETRESGGEPSQLEEETATMSNNDIGKSGSEQAWEKFMVFAKKEKRMLAGILEHGHLLNLDEDKIELGFASNSFFLESANDTENRKQLKDICEKFFEKSMQIKVSSLKEEVNNQSKVQARGRADERKNGSEEEALHHPLVDEALSIFDGKIVEVKKEDFLTK